MKRPYLLRRGVVQPRNRLMAWWQKRQLEHDSRTGFNRRTGVYERGVRQPPNPPPAPLGVSAPPKPPKGK